MLIHLTVTILEITFNRILIVFHVIFALILHKNTTNNHLFPVDCLYQKKKRTKSLGLLSISICIRKDDSTYSFNNVILNTKQHKFSIVIFTLHPDNYYKPTFAVSFNPFTK